jgi:TolB-like protein
MFLFYWRIAMKKMTTMTAVFLSFIFVSACTTPDYHFTPETIEEPERVNPDFQQRYDTAASGNTANANTTSVNTASGDAASAKPAISFYTGDGGKGVVIAVPPPVMQNNSRTNNWIPQFFQDVITGDFARFSAMTVIDRKNESLVLAEQRLSAGGNYSEENYIEMGRLTNARYIVAGTIHTISGRYTVSFRINDTETNEIKTTFRNTYTFQDMENALAAKETVYELLKGIGVELTPEGEKRLLEVNSKTRSTAQLAKGMAAKNEGDIVNALAFLYQSAETDPTQKEAITQINSMPFSVSASSIRERANAGLALQEKWKKILDDLKKYMYNNYALCIVYDFSKVEDKIDYNRKKVDITISPGVQVVINRTALMVWKKLYDEYTKIRSTEESLRQLYLSWYLPRGNGGGNIYRITVGLYDKYNDKISEVEERCWSQVVLGESPSVESNLQVFAQAKYYSPEEYHTPHPDYYSRGYRPLKFLSIPIDKLSDDVLIPKIDKVALQSPIPIDNRRDIKEINIPLYTPQEWREWIAANGMSR